MRLHLAIVLVCLGAGCRVSSAVDGGGAHVAQADAGTAPVAGTQEACVDAWLKARGLNAYGDPPDTMYAGGDPTFDETGGGHTSRVEWVFQKHAAARAACSGAGKPTP